MEYQFESIGPLLRWIALAFLFVAVLAAVAVAAGVAALPGWLARRRQHPQFTEDVQIAGIPVMFLIRAKSWMNYLF